MSNPPIINISQSDIEAMMAFVRRRHIDLVAVPSGQTICDRDPAWASIGYDTMQEILVEFVRMKSGSKP